MNTSRNLGHIGRLWRYPASSLAGEERDALAIDGQGADGDRLYGLFDAATGQIAKPEAGRRWHNVPKIATRLASDGTLEIRTPQSEWLPAPSVEADRAASAFLDFDVLIRQFVTDCVDGPKPRYCKAPVHLLTTASLAELKARHPEGDPDPRRFRPNILVEMQPVAGSFPETEWIGRRIAVGDLELTISEPCRRCGFTIIAQEGFGIDSDILRTVVRRNAHNMGVYCRVDRPASIKTGDALRFLD